MTDRNRPRRTLDSKDLAYFEREVIELVKKNLNKPLSERLKVFDRMARAALEQDRAARR